jgi:hypothetical protein
MMNIKDGRRQEAGGRGQKVQFRRGFKPLLNWGHQIENLVGVLNPCSLWSRAEGRKQYSFCKAALCPLPFLIKDGVQNFS